MENLKRMRLLFLVIVYGVICQLSAQIGVCNDYNDPILCHGDLIVASSGLNIQCNEDQWILIFQDEFTGTSLNTDKWYETLGGDDGDDEPLHRTIFHKNDDDGCSRERQIYLSDNISVSDGNLVLEAREEDFTWIGEADVEIKCGDEFLYEVGDTFIEDFEITSGAVRTKADFHPIDTRYEARIKVPLGLALWPAFWLEHHRDELDVFEYFNTLESTHFSTNYHKVFDENRIGCSMKHCFNTVLTNDFHTYAVETSYWNIKYYFDGQLIREVPRVWSEIGQQLNNDCNVLSPGTYLVDKIYPDVNVNRRWGPILNLAVHHDTEYNNETIKSYLPAQMLVDYVRIYRKNPEPWLDNLCEVNFQGIKDDYCFDEVGGLRISSTQSILEVEASSSSNVSILEINDNVVVFETGNVGPGWITVFITFDNDYCPSYEETFHFGIDGIITGTISSNNQNNFLNTVNFISTNNFTINLSNGVYDWEIISGSCNYTTNSNGMNVSGAIENNSSVTFIVKTESECGDSFRTITIVNKKWFIISPNPTQKDNINIELVDIDEYLLFGKLFKSLLIVDLYSNIVYSGVLDIDNFDRKILNNLNVKSGVYQFIFLTEDDYSEIHNIIIN